jgi:hypothetical protein
MKDKVYSTELNPVIPSKGEIQFAKSLEGQMLKQLGKAVDDKHYIEAVLLAWSNIEQIRLPRLIKFVADQLKVELPNDIQKLNLQTTNLLYYTLSHDKDLYLKLEKGRWYRNRIIHKMYKENSLSEIEKLSKEATKYFLKEIELGIRDRYNGETKIPSINLYRDGWNDALSQAVKIIKKS